MGKTTEKGRSAAEFLPAQSPEELQSQSLDDLRAAAQHCKGCDLYKQATQTVFGEGSPDAQLVFVGEQPGDSEDREGEPFVGPAGRLLQRVMDEVGIPRESVYITNAVKHFKWKPAGRRRLHQKPSSREISACRPWLEAEVTVLKPEMIVCLGATAAGAILGSGFRLTKQRGEVFETDLAPWTIATYHPSALLRSPNRESREEMMELFRSDLQLCQQHLQSLA